MSSLFSIVIPVYNTEKYLQDCIESIIHQSVSSTEVIFINDCSTDKSTTIIDQYMAQIKNVKILSNETRKGAGYCRNRGLREASGKYIIFLDSDDFLCDSTALETIEKFFSENEIDVVCYDYSYFNDETKEYKENTAKIKKKLASHFKEPQFILNSREYPEIFLMPAYPWNKAYDRAWIISNEFKFTETMCHNDLAFSWITMIKAEEIGYIKKTLISHRYSSDARQISNDSSNNRIDLIQALNEVNNFISSNAEYHYIYPFLLKFMWDLYLWARQKVSKSYYLSFSTKFFYLFNPMLKEWEYEFYKQFNITTRQKLKYRIIRTLPFYYSLITFLRKIKNDS